MKPTSLFFKIALVFSLCLLLGATDLLSARADAAPPPDPTVGGVGPYKPQKTNVQMMSETVLINVPRSPSNIEEPKQIKVNASFTMRNQGQAPEQMQVIFPLTRLNTWSPEEALYAVDGDSFVVSVDGKLIPISTITTPPEVTASGPEAGFAPDVEWAAFDVTFPLHQDVMLEVEYNMLNPYGVYGEGFTGISYILETGAGWYGNILSADITLRLPNPVTEEVIKRANPGYILSGNEMHWTLKNFEPTREDNLDVGVIHVDQWQAILDLRARVEQNPADSESWAVLGDWYQILSIFPAPENLPNYSINQHFADLTLEARQKVVELRPEWGNAHFRLAQILWFTNPSVEERFSSSATKREFLQPDDPSIQDVMHELDLGWSYGFDGNVEPFDVEQFQRRINQAVPGLELTAPAAATPAVTPTATFIPIPTNTELPTAVPTLIPTISPTPVPAPPETGPQIPFGMIIAALFGSAAILFLFSRRLISSADGNGKG